MRKRKLLSSLLTIIIVSFAVSPAFALGADQRNMLMIGVMAVSPIIIVSYRRYYLTDIWLMLFMLAIIFSPLVSNPESMRWSTVIYTLMFGTTFLAYSQLLRSGYYTVVNYQNVLKYLIYAYFVVLLIQQFCVLAGLPIFNISNYDPGEPWKLNSLTSEPSQSARTMALLMFSYITTKELILERTYDFNINISQDKWVWIAFLWTMVTMGSGTAFLFLAIVLMQFIKPRNLIPLFVIAGLVGTFASIFDISSFERTYKVFVATLTLNPDSIIEADHSAAFRIVPLLILAQKVGVTTFSDWFGHGVDYVGSFLSILMPGLPKGYTGGGQFQLWLDFGFLSFLLFMIFSTLHSFRQKDYSSIAFWFLLIFIYNINNQIVWLCLILLVTNKYFYKKNAKRIERLKSK